MIRGLKLEAYDPDAALRERAAAGLEELARWNKFNPVAYNERKGSAVKKLRGETAWPTKEDVR